MKKVKVIPPNEISNCTIDLPTSKSIANRLLIINSVSNPNFKPVNLSESEDTKVLIEILNNLKNEIDAGDAGTVYRFLTALLSVRPGSWNLTGSQRMHERPIGHLVDALKQAGADISYLKENGFPPLKINGRTLKGGRIEVDPSLSSQFVSALLMIAPLFTDGLDLYLTKEPASVPYIQMTIDLMKRNGVKVDWQEDLIHVSPGNYSVRSSPVEPDWSAAAFWYELCALSQNGSIFLPGLSKNSIQGDERIAEIMSRFSVRTEYSSEGVHIFKDPNLTTVNYFHADCNDIPDLVPVLVCTCVGLGIEAKISNVHTLRIKESNRIQAMQSELAKLGVRLNYDNDDDNLYVEQGGMTTFTGELNTYNDHRIAMALAPLSIICGPLVLDDPAVVSKSYPAYWDHLILSGFKLEYN
ncbi:MAG TPA: 3-phosphoshikimate 1-carboxyvinyltransferase [Bacteroidia bacterium]|nr:3-phosphoshikimate 1-carboxyvinyltransferase [Bacteroidia bacterium]